MSERWPLPNSIEAWKDYHLKKQPVKPVLGKCWIKVSVGAPWVAQTVEPPTLDFGSGHDLHSLEGLSTGKIEYCTWNWLPCEKCCRVELVLVVLHQHPYLYTGPTSSKTVSVFWRMTQFGSESKQLDQMLWESSQLITKYIQIACHISNQRYSTGMDWTNCL